MTTDTTTKEDTTKEGTTTKDGADTSADNNEAWRARLAGLTLGKPWKHGGLCQYPLLGSDLGTVRYGLLEAALASGTVTLTETSLGGSVPTLTLTNTGAGCVLLLDGEELLGAKQNRIINTTVLAGPHATLALPVTCVEAGRWQQDTAQFVSGGSLYNARGRQQKVAEVSESLARSGRAESDQSRVWADIGGKLERLAVSSPTAALHDITERYGSDLRSYTDALARPLPGQVGSVFALGREIVGLDLFDQAQTLAALLPKLTASYALDALEEVWAEAPPPISVVQAWLSRAALAGSETHPAVGLGEDRRLTGSNLSGAALEYEGVVLHLSLFASAGASSPPHTRLSRPSQRRRH